MPLQPPCDDEGRPIDYERYDRMVEREYAAEEGLHVERLLTIDESMVHLVVLDGRNRIRGALALAADAMTLDDPEWLLERVRRALRPDLRIVG
jgi:hypothetical protein